MYTEDNLNKRAQLKKDPLVKKQIDQVCIVNHWNYYHWLLALGYLGKDRDRSAGSCRLP